MAYPTYVLLFSIGKPRLGYYSAPFLTLTGLKSVLFGIGEIFSITCAMCWAIAVIMFKRIGDTMEASPLNLCKNALGLVFLIPTAMLIEGVALPQLDWAQWGVLVVSGVLGIAIADTWFLKALERVGAGRTAIIASLYSPFVVCLSFIYLGERFIAAQWLGFVLVLSGILIAVYQKHYQDISRKQLLTGCAFGAASIFLTASSVVMMKPVLQQGSFLWLVSLRLLVGVITILIFYGAQSELKSNWKHIVSSAHNWRAIWVSSIFGTYLAMTFWLAGYKYTDASISSVLNETSSIMIILLAWLVLKETLTLRKMIGVLMTFSGVALFVLVSD